MSKLTEFKKELKELLTKYDACIEFGCSDCSDLHGVTEECMEVTMKDGNGKRKTSKLCEGYSVDSHDLRKFK